jgi:Uma2 family endonuclease
MIAETAFRSEAVFNQKEFRRWLDRRPQSDINRYELIDGRVVMTPPAGWPHASIGATLAGRLSDHVRAGKLGFVLDSSGGYDLPSGDTVEPDVSFISTKRFAGGPKPLPGQFLRIVPNLVIEILSPSTSLRDRTEKKKLYERNRVDEYWIVDPVHEEVTVLRLGKAGYAPSRTAKRGRVPSRVLPGLVLTVADIFDL